MIKPRLRMEPKSRTSDRDVPKRIVGEVFTGPKCNKCIPNQFFDVALKDKDALLSVIRLLAYIFYKKWYLDGHPFRLTNTELEKHAKISTGSIGNAKNTAIKLKYIKCAGQPNLYIICFDKENFYHNSLNKFNGFYGGRGNFTRVPKEVFEIIAHERLSVIKTVLVILRLTLGYHKGQIQMSLTQLIAETNLSRSALSEALKYALSRNYIIRVGKDKNGWIYSTKWNVSECNLGRTEFKRSEFKPLKPERDKIHALKRTKPEREWHKIQTSDKGVYINNLKKINKQQQKNVVAADESLKSFELLKRVSVGDFKAKELSEKFSNKSIKNQIEWLPYRTATTNSVGLLIRSIEGNWAKPECLNSINRDAAEFASHFYAELGGNKGKPVAPPSARDVECAENFLSELRAISPDGSIRESAREFGRFIKRNQRKDVWPIPSFVLALRCNGEIFLAKTREQAQIGKYYAYLDSQETLIKTKHPGIYRKFLDEIFKREQSSENSKPKTSKREHANAFVCYFKNHSVCPVMNFDTWKKNRIHQKSQSEEIKRD